MTYQGISMPNQIKAPAIGGSMQPVTILHYSPFTVITLDCHHWITNVL